MRLNRRCSGFRSDRMGGVAAANPQVWSLKSGASGLSLLHRRRQETARNAGRRTIGSRRSGRSGSIRCRSRAIRTRRPRGADAGIVQSGADAAGRGRIARRARLSAIAVARAGGCLRIAVRRLSRRIVRGRRHAVVRRIIAGRTPGRSAASRRDIVAGRAGSPTGIRSFGRWRARLRRRVALRPPAGCSRCCPAARADRLANIRRRRNRCWRWESIRFRPGLRPPAPLSLARRLVASWSWAIRRKERRCAPNGIVDPP